MFGKHINQGKVAPVKENYQHRFFARLVFGQLLGLLPFLDARVLSKMIPRATGTHHLPRNESSSLSLPSSEKMTWFVF
jgi:hypothetical protein